MRKLEQLNAATVLRDLAVPPSNRLHALTGDLDPTLIPAIGQRLLELREQIKNKAERLSKATTKKAKDTVKKQISALKKLRAQAREEGRDLRTELAAVRADLANARQHLSRALHMDKALAAFESQRQKAAKSIAKMRKKQKSRKSKAIRSGTPPMP